MLSFKTGYEGITQVYKELSSIIPKIWCIVGEMLKNRSFFENKRLFLKETHMVLCSACRVQRMLSNETSSEGITPVFKELPQSYSKYRVPLLKCTKFDVSSSINHNFL